MHDRDNNKKDLGDYSGGSATHDDQFEVAEPPQHHLSHHFYAFRIQIHVIKPQAYLLWE